MDRRALRAASGAVAADLRSRVGGRVGGAQARVVRGVGTAGPPSSATSGSSVRRLLGERGRSGRCSTLTRRIREATPSSASHSPSVTPYGQWKSESTIVRAVSSGARGERAGAFTTEAGRIAHRVRCLCSICLPGGLTTLVRAGHEPHGRSGCRARARTMEEHEASARAVCRSGRCSRLPSSGREVVRSGWLAASAHRRSQDTGSAQRGRQRSRAAKMGDPESRHRYEICAVPSLRLIGMLSE